MAAFVLTIREEDGFLIVGERTPGDRLPAACPELHINPGGSFCIGRWSFRVREARQVAAFWQSLGEYLVNQHHAGRRGFWPGGRWLSHGAVAADAQLEAEKAAEEAGIGEEYSAWLETGEGWLGRMPPVDPTTGRLHLRGISCPRGCEDANGLPMPLRACQHRATMVRLIEAEALRRGGEARFFNALRSQGAACCGRMAGCPLAAKEAA
ncbi:E2 domain-containing protein [Sphingomonas sp. KR3-1]|uniref:E2 domain-containing protein n=1 Tax=Sphingomonas sp. KR3-1 TaxID=3156611 RepID=UPI0032B3CE36